MHLSDLLRLSLVTISLITYSKRLVKSRFRWIKF